jgi:NTE family protein
MVRSRGSSKQAAIRTAFVLGGGGALGAYEVGMLRGLLEAGIQPDLVVGTSVGALNGAAVAAEPDLAAVERLEQVWRGLATDPALGGSVFGAAANLMKTRTALYSNRHLRGLIERALPVRMIEELNVRFECVAASIERAAEHWFTTGPIVEAVLASTAVPGLLPPVEIDGEHFVDGGLVNSVPVGRALIHGASDVYVLHVGRIERTLTAPRNIVQVALTSFEVARRSRFVRDMTEIPPGVNVFVLPVGAPDGSTLTNFRYRNARAVDRRIEQAYEATSSYLRARAG